MRNNIESLHSDSRLVGLNKVSFVGCVVIDTEKKQIEYK